MAVPSTTVRAKRARPLPRPQRWTVDVAAPGTVDSWEDPARRLVDVLSEIGTATRDEYGQRVAWHSPDTDPGTWSDVAAVHTLMHRTHQERSQQEQAQPERPHRAEPGSRGLVHGHLGGADSPPIVDLLWRAGADDRVLDCTARFNPRGGARSLARHRPEWLVRLLGRTVDAAGGNSGRIVTSSWLAEDERRMRDGVPALQMVPFWLGELTFVPVDLEQTALPDTLLVHPWWTLRGAGSVVCLADLAATILTPTRAVDDMLVVRRHLPDC